MPLKFGKLSVKYDKRTLKLRNLYRKGLVLPSVSDEYLIDTAFGTQFPISMLGNDAWGDCVIVGRANLTLRFEYHETQSIVPISTNDVLNEYWHEQGYNSTCCLSKILNMTKPDNGLVMLDSLNKWRQEGWKLNGNLYNIYAFASLDKPHHIDIKQAVFFLNGVYMGFNVAKSAMDQFRNGEAWDVVDENSPLEGGHCVTINGYNSIGPVCLTWGKQQQMTWKFWDTYVDEAYGVIDNKNNWIVNNLFDPELLSNQLEVITS
jgi:hypothetical protein